MKVAAVRESLSLSHFVCNSPGSSPDGLKTCSLAVWSASAVCQAFDIQHRWSQIRHDKEKYLTVLSLDLSPGSSRLGHRSRIPDVYSTQKSKEKFRDKIC